MRLHNVENSLDPPPPMPRYAAFLRGVSPTNARMPDVKRAFEGAGFKNVATVLSSGNVVFDAASRSTASIEKKIEAALAEALGRPFPTLVRPIEALLRMLESDPYRGARVPAAAKRVVTFVRGAKGVPKLPIERDGARIVKLEDGVAFSAYVPSPKGPVFMVLIERTFGKDQTTRTWRTIGKVVAK